MPTCGGRMVDRQLLAKTERAWIFYDVHEHIFSHLILISIRRLDSSSRWWMRVFIFAKRRMSWVVLWPLIPHSENFWHRAFWFNLWPLPRVVAPPFSVMKLIFIFDLWGVTFHRWGRETILMRNFLRAGDMFVSRHLALILQNWDVRLV